MDIEIKEEPSSIIVEGYELVGNIGPQKPSTSFTSHEYGHYPSIAELPGPEYSGHNAYVTSNDVYAFDEMQMLLKEWGLEILSERFVQHLIDVSVLEYIVEMDIVDLCKGLPIRYRLILRHKLGQQLYKPSPVTQPTNTTKKKRPQTVPTIPHVPAEHAKFDHPQVSLTSSFTKPITEVLNEQPNGPTEKPHLVTGQFKLADLLQQHEFGRMFLDQYKIENGKRIYSADSRNFIKKALIDHYFRLGRGHISAHQFREMVELIVEELPDEDPNIWYCVATADSSSPTGILYTRYRYVAQKNKQYKKQKDTVVVHHSTVLTQQAKEAWETLSGSEQEACLAAKSKLKQIDNVDIEEVINAWKASYLLRRYEAVMGQLQLDDFQPLTKFERVHDLITYDFCVVHSIASETFYDRVPHFVNRFKTVYLGYKTLIEEDKVLTTAIVSTFMEHGGLTEKETFLAFYSLSYIVRHSFVTVKGRKRRKFNTMQVRNSFITILSAEYMLLDCVQDRKRIADENKDQYKPFIIAVGSLATAIRGYYVVLGELLFPCTTIVGAVDLLFKLYTVFHMDYAYECENTLRFIQGYLYELQFQGERSNIFATTLITDFNRL